MDKVKNTINTQNNALNVFITNLRSVLEITGPITEEEKKRAENHLDKVKQKLKSS